MLTSARDGLVGCSRGAACTRTYWVFVVVVVAAVVVTLSGGDNTQTSSDITPSQRTPVKVVTQLIEFIADKCISPRNAVSANIAFTRSWQSSKVPSIATLAHWRAYGGHLPPLHLAGAILRMQDAISTR